jgi:hypothetical protein
MVEIDNRITHNFGQGLCVREEQAYLAEELAQLTRGHLGLTSLYPQRSLLRRKSGQRHLPQPLDRTFITSFELSATSVGPIVQSGRTRWKIENEHNNVLKNYGYHLEHNYGHGQQHLSAVLLTLNLLAFLIHTILDQTNHTYAAIRAELGTRETFFDDIRTPTRYLYFDSWPALLSFMSTQLEILLEPG